MAHLELLIEDYKRLSQDLEQQSFNLRMNHAREVKRSIYVRAIDNVKHIPFDVCPGEKRVRIRVDEICQDYRVCDLHTGLEYEDWSITIT